ncbi:MAG: polysaccharide biosynthesis C-terminal domain-containing protein [Bacteroidia bacterium]|nr:polysaccharide biosynthesis C-terminal domain-containing protein [Bacteroidia bacterium]
MIKLLIIRLRKQPNLRLLLVDFVISFIIKVLGMGFGFVVLWWIAKTQGDKVLGVYSLCLALLQLLIIPAKFGLDISMVRIGVNQCVKGEFAAFKQTFFRAIIILLLTSSVIAIVLWLARSLLAEKVYHKPYLAEYFMITAVTLVPYALGSLFTEGLRIFRVMRGFAFMSTAAQNIFTLLLLFVSGLFIPDEHPIIWNFWALLLVCVVAIIWFRQVAKLGQVSPSGGMKYSEITKQSYPVMLSALFTTITAQAGLLILGMYKPEAEIAIYNIVIRLSVLTTLSLLAINNLTAPQFAEAHSKQDVWALQVHIRRATRLIFWTSLPLLLIFLLFPSYVMGIFGEQYRVGAWALFIISIGKFFGAISGAVGQLLIMVGEQKILQNAAIITAIIVISLNFLLIPTWGIIGAAAANSLGVVLLNGICIWHIKRKLGFITLYIPFISD